MEIWRPIPDWEGLYEVSDVGRVRSLRRNGLVLRPSYSNTGGYPLVILCLAGKRTGCFIHHAVAAAFIGPRPKAMEIRHLDGDPTNNMLANLAYGTSGQNKLDQVRHGTHPEAARSHCDNGHEFTEENTRIQKTASGAFRQRACRTCHNESVRGREQRNAASGKVCMREDCGKPLIAKGLCWVHYMRQRRAQQSA